MENELNIAAILKDKPKGTKLWSPALGNVRYDCISTYTSYPVYVKYGENGNGFGFTESGKIADNGECLLFPSKLMQDWEKFTWKKGYIIGNTYNHLCIFDSWASDDYTIFYARYYGKEYNEEKMVAYTKNWTKVITQKVIKEYISKIEEVKGGKLNLDTLEMEYETKDIQAEDLPKKYDFQPFDKVLVRDDDDDKWEGDFFFRYFSEDRIFRYYCLGGTYIQCIPYNDSTKHLLGTTKDWEGGEE